MNTVTLVQVGREVEPVRTLLSAGFPGGPLAYRLGQSCCVDLGLTQG